MATLEQYTALITAWHQRPKFLATVGALVAPLVSVINFAEEMTRHYDIDEAVGVQLDVVGQWVGRSRQIEFPIPDVWFSFDDERRGFDLGVWKDETNSWVQFDLHTLDDETYRRLLYAVVLANHWDGRKVTAADAFRAYFESEGTRVFVQDPQDMSMIVGVAGHVPQTFDLAILSAGYIPLKPAGIKADYRITSVEGRPVFGFDVHNEYIAGFDEGAWGVPPSHIVRHGPVVLNQDPDAFTFTPVEDAELETNYVSNEITVMGINIPSPISIVGGAYSLNGADYTEDDGTVTNKDKIAVLVTSSDEYETTVEVVLTIGAVTGTFSVTTAAEV